LARSEIAGEVLGKRVDLVVQRSEFDDSGFGVEQAQVLGMGVAGDEHLVHGTSCSLSRARVNGQ